MCHSSRTGAPDSSQVYPWSAISESLSNCWVVRAPFPWLHRLHKTCRFALKCCPPWATGSMWSISQFPFIDYVGVSHHHPPSIITYSPARTSARKRTTPRERNWSPAPPRRASGQLPHGRTSQPTRQECSDHSSLGVLWFLFTLMRLTKRHARRVLASRRREETAAPTHKMAVSVFTTLSVGVPVEG